MGTVDALNSLFSIICVRIAVTLTAGGFVASQPGSSGRWDSLYTRFRGRTSGTKANQKMDVKKLTI